MLLTGASRGIGHATVKLFNEAGWRVLTVSRSQFDQGCPWTGSAGHIQADFADPESYQHVIAEAQARLGPAGLHALVNNAGISPKKSGGGRLGALDSEYRTWVEVFNVNLFATAALVRGLFQQLKDAAGTIVNITSIAGTQVHPFAGAAYACSKAALSTLTRELASELGAHGIRVNAVSPGEIDTSILSPGTQDIVDREIPMHRLGSPDEVAKTIMFLCSPDSAYINGAVIDVNGGQSV
jgi:NAD(P)-dependent dehydrogenase (short-subunit alcohol dehydrogenase family)